MDLRLPFPDPQLSPNRRRDLRALTPIRRGAHEIGVWSVKASGLKLRSVPLEMRIIFFPPDNRRRDLDNCYSSFKAYQDGIFEALGVDDKFIWRVILDWGNPCDKGEVLVQIKEMEVPRRKM